MITGTILTVGEILVEIMASERGEGFREAQNLRGPFPSGAPAIFIDQVGKLGHPAAIVSAVGDDDFGRLNLDRLAADGVDTSAVAVLVGHATGSAFVRYRPDGARDFVFNIRHSASGCVAPTPAARDAIEACGHLHVMGSSLSIPAMADWMAQAAASVGARGGKVSFDPNIRKEILDDPQVRHALDTVLGHTDLFLPSGDELLMLSGEASVEAAVAHLLGQGIAEIVLKCGADGAIHYDRSGATRSPGFAVAEIDPTGAGDCFGATFVVCRRRGMAVGEALRYANAAGALAVGAMGPMEGASTFAELDAFLAAQPH